MRAARVSAEARSARPRRTPPHHNGGAVLSIAEWRMAVAIPTRASSGPRLSHGADARSPLDLLWSPPPVDAAEIWGSYAQ
jgi:hypothetical protein